MITWKDRARDHRFTTGETTISIIVAATKARKCQPSHWKEPEMITWKDRARDHRFTTGENLICGRVPVGMYHRNGLSRKPEEAYPWHLELPGKKRSGYALTAEEAKAALEAAFKDWLEAANLKERD